MTDAQIIQLVEKHFYSSFITDNWSGETEDILEFARAMYEEGYDQGCYEATGGQ
jgi:hypothetical protein